MSGQLPHLTGLLVTVDRSADAEIAITWGRALATALHLPITLVHVLDRTRIQDDVQVARAMAEDRLAILASDRRLRDIDVNCLLLAGDTAEELSKLGLENPGSVLILVATATGDDKVSPVVMGSSLEHIVRDMQTGYMLIPAYAHAPERVENIVIGYDQSPLTGEVLRIARSVGRSMDVGVISVEAVEPGTRPADEFVKVAPVIQDDHIMVRGRASRILLATARARNAAMIVIGSHGVGESEQMLMGSTAQWLSRHADRPVVIIPRPR